jgi:TetR/AcrR family tetracycline transcriptional repressor
MGRASRLSREGIVREAIALLNEQGLADVSLRKLAARLGAQAPSLARHVGDKAQLLALMSSTIFGEALASIPPGLTGDAWLEAFGHALRRKQSETRDISALLSTVPANAALDEAAGLRLRALMRDAELEGPRAQLEQAAIQALVTGWMTFEKSERADLFAARLPSDHAFEDSLRALIAGFAATR